MRDPQKRDLVRVLGRGRLSRRRSRLALFQLRFCVYFRGQKTRRGRAERARAAQCPQCLGVIALAVELGIPFEKIAASLRKFEHARRRFEIKYESERFLLVDDYAHHPTEIRATLKNCAATGRKRVLAHVSTPSLFAHESAMHVV